eukprot:m.287868 g.287868  ORF g.287868 m.287868 type:complete len:292 (-) comp11860_c0_seq1:27-902(-)
MRSVFPAPPKRTIQWFPGHMARGLRDILRQTVACDGVIEVHDARIPLSGRNHKFDQLQGIPRLLILNKADLADPSQFKAVRKEFARQGLPVVHTNCANQHGRDIKMVTRAILGLADANASHKAMRLLVVGMPNVGKSSLINALRRNNLNKGNCAPAGNKPGVTRRVQNEIVIHRDPPVLLVDTPGVMMPNVEDFEMGMKLALIGTLRDDVVGEELIADYLLFELNRRGISQYVEDFQLDGPSDDISHVLEVIARRRGALMKGGIPDLRKAAGLFLRQFRSGGFGRLSLDTL